MATTAMTMPDIESEFVQMHAENQSNVGNKRSTDNMP